MVAVASKALRKQIVSLHQMQMSLVDQSRQTLTVSGAAAVAVAVAVVARLEQTPMVRQRTAGQMLNHPLGQQQPDQTELFASQRLQILRR